MVMMIIIMMMMMMIIIIIIIIILIMWQKSDITWLHDKQVKLLQTYLNFRHRASCI